MKYILLAALAVVLSGCAASKRERVVQAVNTLPTNEVPAYLAKSYSQGNLTQEQYNDLMGQWRKVKAEEDEEAKLLAQMTASERAHYKLRKREIELQEQQLATQEDIAQTQRAAMGAAMLQSNSQYLQTQQIVAGQAAQR